MKIGNEKVHVTEIDWEKRNWKKILTPEEEREIGAKMLRLNGGPDYDPEIERLLAAASSAKKKPTFKVKRLGSDKLKGAFSISKESEKAEKAMRLNGVI
jgi:trans-2-enoyl-CoA reductase